MCNPYLTFAAMLAAGLDGIRNKIEPPESIDTNIYHLSADERKKMGIEMLPASLMEAQIELEKDAVIRKVMGSHVMDGLTSIATVESDLFRLAVHPWEIERYLATY
jgi:glutamine synthetase